jgi:hypothetical protein
MTIARFINDNAPEENARYLGEIVTFNCNSYEQAIRFKGVFEKNEAGKLTGNGMIEIVANSIGATRVEYFIKG